jgi:chemotaxis protein methyltransferase CheR
MAWDAARVRRYVQDELGMDTDRVSEQWLASMVDAAVSEAAAGTAVERALESAATINESMFMRHTKQFAWVREHWLPAALADRSGRNSYKNSRPMRILSAPSARGEEPYSLAATVAGALPLGPRPVVEVVGLELDRTCLSQARAARYTRWALRGVDLKEHGAWLRVDGDTVEVAPEVRRLVRFFHHNLLQTATRFGRFELIFCRNLLIYLHESAVAAVYDNLAACLAVDGALIVAPADPGPPADSCLEARWEHGTRVVRHRGAPAVRGPASRPTAPLPRRPPRRPAAPPQKPAAAPADRLAHAAQLAAEQRFPAAREQLDALLADEPLYLPALLLLVLVAIGLDEHTLAVDAARRASFLEPDAPYPAYLLGMALARAGRATAARRSLRWAGTLLQDRPADAAVPFAGELTVSQLKELIDVDLAAFR